MLRYHPPKSNIWGHSLRGMKPSQERAAAGAFEKKAVARSTFGASTLWITRAQPDQAIPTELIQRFENALKKESREGFFPIVEPEFETAFEVLVSMEAGLPGLQGQIRLSRLVKIQAWLIAGVAVPTTSTLTWNFGSSAYISTFFQFNARAEFDFVSAVLAELKICRLNEKHLKPMRRTK